MPAGTINLAGRLSVAQSACVIAGARLYVGPDTLTTHVAAALGVPTVALYGPSNPVKWGPWPKDFAGATSPWRRVGVQSMGNVELVQGVGACVPCMREGCDQHVASFSDVPDGNCRCPRHRGGRARDGADPRERVRQSGSPQPGRPASANRNVLATAGHSRSTVWVRPLKLSRWP